MNKYYLLEKINQLISKSKARDTFKIEEMFEEYLEKNPTDIDMWIHMAVFELQDPFSYYPKSIECINKVLEIDPVNFDAILLFACINHFHVPEYDIKVLELLSRIRTDDPEKLSMIEYVKSWSYYRIEEDIYRKFHGNYQGFYSSQENYKQYENALKKSIELYPYNVFNYKDLAYLYDKTNNKVESVRLNKISDENKIKYNEIKQFIDYTSIKSYFDEFVTGTNLKPNSNEY